MKAPQACVNCKRVQPIHARGLCRACWGYERIHRRPRPPEGVHAVPQYCTECGALMPRSRRRAGLCNACYQRTYRPSRAKGPPPEPPYIPMPVRHLPPLVTARCGRCSGQMAYDGEIPFGQAVYACLSCGWEWFVRLPALVPA